MSSGPDIIMFLSGESRSSIMSIPSAIPLHRTDRREAIAAMLGLRYAHAGNCTLWQLFFVVDRCIGDFLPPEFQMYGIPSPLAQRLGR